MSELILIAGDIEKLYREGQEKLTVLKGLSFQLKKGEMAIITGPSGSGKSTLLHLLGLLDLPDKGRIIIDGKDTGRLSEAERSRIRKEMIGFVFQYHYLFNEFTAIENVMVPLILNGFNEQKAYKRAKEVMEQLGIGERISHLPSELSGGEAQRVQLARAIVKKPELLLLDEPTGNLDQKRSIELMELLKKLNREQDITICMVSHNLSLIPYFDVHYELKDGRLVKSNSNTEH